MDAPFPYGGRYKYLVTDTLITAEPCLLCSVIVTVETTGHWIDLYDGQDTGGRPIVRVKALANRSIMWSTPHGVLCQRGLYIAFSHAGDKATICIHPLPDEPAGEA